MLVKALEHRPQRIKCSLNDHFVFRAAVSVVFFYRQHIPSEIITKSLQYVLNDFPIFAGIIIKREHQLYIDCNNQGVQVNIAHTEKYLFQNSPDFEKLNSATFVDKINPSKALKHSTPLLTIKLNYHTDGMAIGYCWHHSLGDMSTFMEFLKALSAHAKNENYQPAFPINDRDRYLNDWIETTRKCPHIEPPCNLKYISFMDIVRLVKHICWPKKSLYLSFSAGDIERLREAISLKVGRKLSRSDVICAHLLDLIRSCRNDNALIHHASIVLNFRPRIGMLPQVLGNCLDTVSIKSDPTHSVEAIADAINSSVKNYLYERFCHKKAQKFVQQCGGLQKLWRILPKDLLPEYKNLIISNWSNFGVYSIDFGITAPYLFLPSGQAPFPWVACVVEGFENQGHLVTIALPSNIAKRLSRLIDKKYAASLPLV